MEQKQPNIDSVDREERIQARRARLRERLAKERARGTAAEEEEKQKQKAAARTREEVAADDEREQVAASLASIEAARRGADEAVFAVRLEAENEETHRRENAESQRVELAKKAESEKEATSKGTSEVRARWAALTSITVADELETAIQEQKTKADGILTVLDKAINAHRQLIVDRSDEFQKLLQHQSGQVDTILERLRKQGDVVRQLIDSEMSRLEDWLSASTEAIRAEYSEKIQELCERKSSLEEKMQSVRLGQRRDDESVKDAANRRDAEECAVLKARLEEEVQALQLSLQQMRATYLLSTEKLDHNMRLLAQRETLHAEQIAAGKAKINRLQDVLTQLKTKSSRLERQYSQRISELNDEFGRLVSTYKDYNKKDADTKKLEEMWAMVRERASEIVTKLLTADRVIHERVLGLRWCNPNRNVFNEAPDIRAELTSSQSARDGNGTPRTQSQYSDSLEEQVLKMLCKEIDDSKVKAILDQAGGTANEQQRVSVTISALLDALHITEKTDVDKLVSFFVIEAASNPTEQQTEPTAPSTTTENATDSNSKTLAKLTREQALAALRSYAQEHERDAAALIRRKDKEDLALALEQEKQIQEIFWSHVVEVVGPKAVQLWKGILEELESFQAILRRRQELLEHNKALKAKNEQMRTTLNSRIAKPDPTLKIHSLQRDDQPTSALPQSFLSGTSRGVIP